MHTKTQSVGIGIVTALDDADEYVRAWAIQLLCEDHAPSTRALNKFVTLAQSDHSAVVRLYLASALQRLEPDRRWPIAAQLVTRGPGE